MGVVSPVSAGVVRGGGVRCGKSMRQLEEAVLQVLVEAVGGGECPGVAEISGRAGGAGVVSPASAGVVSVGVVCVGKSMRQLEEAVLEVLVEARRDGECPGVAEISGRAGIWSGKGEASKGEPGSVGHSIAWGIFLKLFRAGLIRKCPKSPGRSGYEPTELAVDRMRDGVENG